MDLSWDLTCLFGLSWIYPSLPRMLAHGKFPCHPGIRNLGFLVDPSYWLMIFITKSSRNNNSKNPKNNLRWDHARYTTPWIFYRFLKKISESEKQSVYFTLFYTNVFLLGIDNFEQTPQIQSPETFKVRLGWHGSRLRMPKEQNQQMFQLKMKNMFIWWTSTN